jgi:DNA polymerase III delta prime subunit
MTEHTIWVEKYRPDTVDGYIGNDALKSKMSRYIAESDVPHLLLSGPPGTGKTTMAKILVKNIDCDFLYINASDENNVDTVRNKLKTFASSSGFRDQKIAILDEADFLTPNAQAALRNLMETFSKHCRFILTCNYEERIIDAIVSRTQHFHVVPPTKLEVAKHVAGILTKEQVEYKPADIKLLIDAHYPDIRKIIGTCQLHTHDGVLKLDAEEIVQSDVKLQIVTLLGQKMDPKKKFQEIRQLIADAKIRDFTDLYALCYEKVDEYGKGNISGVIRAIAEAQKYDSQVVNKEINFMSMIIDVLQVIG